MNLVREREIPWLLLGGGSNLLFSDAGFSGVIIRLEGEFTRLVTEGANLICGAGARCSAVVSRAREAGLKGVEFLQGIPGTMGGAVRMNAGAWGGEVGSLVLRLGLLDPEGREISMTGAEAKFGYRHMAALGDNVVLEVELGLAPASRTEIEARIRRIQEERRRRQPLEYPSLGSVFRNPPDVSAGKLLEEAGCKELRVGEIMVSPRHANFFINLGNGTADDFRRLVDEVRERVRRHSGRELELEVELVGFAK
jgi:UDP-N-acetylmuramate dehydrogenase